jgi:hypothetical protein
MERRSSYTTLTDVAGTHLVRPDGLGPTAHEREHGLRMKWVLHRCQLAPGSSACPQLLDDATQLGSDLLGRGLSEDGAHHGGHEGAAPTCTTTTSTPGH